VKFYDGQRSAEVTDETEGVTDVADDSKELELLLAEPTVELNVSTS
jgi:hypothetical protein